MLTVEIKLNGKVVGEAQIRNVTALAEVSTYDVVWAESAAPDLGVPLSSGGFLISGHRRRQSAWALVAKVVGGILGEMVAQAERRGR